MKITIVMSVSLMMAAFFSCSETRFSTDEIDNLFIKKSLSISLNENGTRLAVVDGQVNNQAPNLTWQSTDKLAVWSDGEPTKYIFAFTQLGNYSNYAEFTCERFPTTSQQKQLDIVYPDTESVEYDANSNQFRVTIPAFQKAVNGSFDPKAAVCAGATKSSTDHSVTLSHACGFLKVTTTQAAKSIVLETTLREKEDGSTESYSICGPILLAPRTAGATPTVLNQTNTRIEMNMTGTNTPSDEMIPAGTYLFAVLPSSNYPGFRLTINYGENDSRTGTYEPFAISAASIYNLGTLPESEK